MIHDDGPNCTPVERVLAALGDGVRPSGNGWVCRCPAHDDRKPSLSVAEGDDGRALLNCHAGCKPDDVVAALGLTMADLFPPTPGCARVTFNPSPPRKPTGKAFATAAEAVADLERRHGKRAGLWTYTDAAGTPVMVVVRFNRGDGSKDFRPVHRAADVWRVGAMPKPRPLYLLPGLPAADVVLVCEGEKAADAARSLGFTVTTSAGGSQAAGQTDWSPLAGKSVVVLPDNDPPGRKYADHVKGLLANLSPAPTVKVVDLPDLPEKGDIVDWIADRDADDVGKELAKLIAAARVSTPHRGGRWQPTLIRADEVVMRAIHWHWSGRIPAGRITLLSGRPGASKSVVTCFIAAVTTNGGLWPANEGIAPKGGVIFLAAEDDPADTVVPRLAAAGADLSKVVLLDGKHAPDPNDPERVLKLSVTLQDIDQIAAALDQMPDCKLIVIDPVGSYMGGKVDSHRDTEVRSVLAPLAQLARDRNVAVLLVAHTNKAVNQFADDSVLGSRAFVGIARSVLHFSTDPEDRERKLLLPGKNNLAKEMPGLAYRVEEEPTVIGHPPKIVWEDEPVHGVTADQHLGSVGGGRGDGQRGRPECDREEERTFLEELLNDQPNGVAFKFIEKEAKEAGLNMKAVRKAAGELEVVKKKQPANIKAGQVSKWFWGFGNDWEPPAATVEDARNDEPAKAESPGHSNFGHLRENTPETPDFLEDARSEEFRAPSTVDTPSGHLRVEDSRPPADVSKMSEIHDGGNLRGTKGETANSVEGARNSRVLEKALKPTRRKKAKPAPPPADPITDTDAFLSAVRQAGWTPAQAVGWLTEQDEYVPGDDLAGTHGGQRRKLLDHLAANCEREVSA